MPPPPPTSAPLVVLPVPGGHGYVANLLDPRVPGVQVLPEDPPSGPGWSPPPALEASWVKANADRFDVLHLHFGFEGRTPEQLRDLVTALRAVDRPFVLTVHDLENPHLSDQRPYVDLLDVLVPAAAALVTLTPGAAEEVERRWGRTPFVVPHPHLAPLEEIGVPRPAHSPRVVGVHLKSLRANLRALPALRALATAVERLPDTVLRVDVHGEALDPGFLRHDVELTAWLHENAAAGRIDLQVHDRFDDEELADHLRGLDVSVLAYGHGTHSGWLELCHDLGVAVLADRIGYLHQQQTLVQVDLADPDAVTSGLERAMAGPAGFAADRERRRAQREEIAVEHRTIYRRVASGVPVLPVSVGSAVSEVVA